MWFSYFKYMYSCYNTFIVKKYELYMDVAKGMLLYQIDLMKLINVSVGSKHWHPPLTLCNPRPFDQNICPREGKDLTERSTNS